MVENKKSFLERLEGKVSPNEQTRIRAAYIFSKFGHRAQKREELSPKGEPLRYFEHARRTALILMDELNIYDSNMIITALLHDCCEDTDDIDAGIIELFFGTEVCRNVLYLTKTPRCKGDKYWSKLCLAPDSVVTVKGCDRLDNLRSLDKCGKDKIKRKIDETINYFYEGELSYRIPPDLFNSIQDEVIRIARTAGLTPPPRRFPRGLAGSWFNQKESIF